VSPIIAALKKYVDGHINETVERRNFRRRFQQPGESFDNYLVSLRELVKTFAQRLAVRKVSVIRLLRG